MAGPNLRFRSNLFVFLFIGHGVGQTNAASLALIGDCEINPSPFSCGPFEALPPLREKYPDDTFTGLPNVNSADCATWLEANAAQYHVVVAPGFQYGDCFTAAKDNANFKDTWLVNIDGCGEGGDNLICALFDERQVGYAAGYLAGLTSTTKVVGFVGGVPVPAVWRLTNGYRVGVEASCPECSVEGVYVNSFAHANNADAAAEWLIGLSADVIYGAGGGTGSWAIVRAAELGAMVIGVDVDEFITELWTSGDGFAVRHKLLSSAAKIMPTAVSIIASLLLRPAPGSAVDGVEAGNLRFDYANGALGLADCHLACDAVGPSTWQTAMRKERDLAAGLVSIAVSASGHIPLPQVVEPNTFVVSKNSASPPPPRVQHAMTTYSSAWKSHIAIFGGMGDSGPLSDFWLYEIEPAKWYATPPGMTHGTPPPALTKPCAVGLGASVLIFGGRTTDSKQSDQVFTFTDQPDFLGFGDPFSELIRYTWSNLQNEGTAPAVEGAACVSISDTCAAVFGGRSQFNEEADVSQVCVEEGLARWTSIWEASASSGPAPRELPGVGVVPGSGVGLPDADRVLVIVGGTSNNGGNTLTDAWALTLDSSPPVWTQLPDLPFPLSSQPMVFTAPAPSSDGTTTSEIVALQLTSEHENIGLGALVLDLAKGSWAPQAGVLAESARSAGQLSRATAIQTKGRSWIFGGSAEDVYSSDLLQAEFAFQKGCQPGQEADGIRCVNCSAGFTSAGEAGAVCMPCAAGRFASSEGSSECDACNAGFYSQAGNATCTACPAGTSTQGRRGEPVCFECPQGQYAEFGWPSCEICSFGSFQSGFGGTACTACAGDLTTAFPGAMKSEQCICPEGQYRPIQADAARTSCNLCPEGATCAVGSDMLFMPAQSGNTSESLAGEIPMLQEGYYSRYSDPLSIFLCGSLQHCPGGLPESCAGGRSGLNCGECPDGTVPDKAGCGECGGAAAVQCILVIILVLLAFPPVIYYLGNGKMTGSAGRISGMLLLVGIAVTTAQLLATFKRLNVAWPTGVGTTFGAFDFFLFNPDSIGVECLTGNSAVAIFLLKFLLPFLMVAAIMLFLPASRLLRAFGKSSWSFDKTLNSIGAFLQAVFIAIVGIVAAPFQCYSHPNGEKSVASTPQVLCGSSEHTSLIIMALGLLLLIVLPYAAINVWASCVVRSLQNKGNMSVIVRFRYLFYRFRPDVWWWGNVYLLRQLLLAFSPMIQPDDPAIQVVFVTCVMQVYTAILCYFWPWSAWEVNCMDAWSILMLSMIAVGVSSFMPASEWPGIHKEVLWVFIAFVFAFCIGVLVYAISDIARRGRQGSFGVLRYPNRKTMDELAREWLSVCFSYTEVDEAATKAWLELMNDYDRKVVDQAISLVQSYSLNGVRNIHSRETASRLILDTSSPTADAPARSTASRDKLVVI
jgi:basic membrane lipoprotein Med (substrate-binding protein (PBP1-ABC) superfamily)